MSNYLVYGTIRRIDSQRVGGFLGLGARLRKVIVLSTGHRIVIDNNCEHTLETGESYFISCYGRDSRNLFLDGTSYRPCHEIEKLQKLASNLEDAGKRAVDMTNALNSRDRGLVFNAVGITLAGTFTAINAVNAVGNLAGAVSGSLEPTTAITGATISGVLAAASGTYTYLQYEALSESLKSRADVVSKYKKAHKLYSKLMLKYIPIGCAGAIPLNPEVRSAIQPLRNTFTMGLTKAHEIANFFKANIQYVGA